MSSVVVIPLDKNPEVSDLALDLQPGQKIYGCFSVKSKDDQTLSLRIEHFARSKDDLPEPDEYDDESDEVDEVDEGEKGANDEEDGDGSDDQEREEARSQSGY